MPANTNVSMMNEIMEQAYEHIMEMSPILIASMQGPDGAFGNVPLSRSDRILQFMDDAQSGALDIQRVQATWRYDERVKQFYKDMATEAQHMNGAR